MVLEAVKNNGFSLRFASYELRNDKEVVLEAVKNVGFALQFASETLRNDREVVLEAVKGSDFHHHFTDILEFTSEEIRNDKEVNLEVLKKCTSEIDFNCVSDELWKDKNFVIEAVTKNGYALQWAS